jgi:nitroreductase
MMIESIKHRRSVRKFQEKPIEEEKLLEILEAARLAPSGNNKQPWVFIVIKNEENRKKVAQVTGEQLWIASAPVVIVAVADLSARSDRFEGQYLDEESPQFDLKRSIRDTAIAVEHILLEADNQGLGTCWCGAFRQKTIRPVLNIPDDKFVLAVIPLGYADEAPKARPRKDLETILCYERW